MRRHLLAALAALGLAQPAVALINANTINPATQLQVASVTVNCGNVSGSASCFDVAGATLTVLRNGRVGIGKASPEFILDVVGQANLRHVNSQVRVDNTLGTILNYAGSSVTLGTSNYWLYLNNIEIIHNTTSRMTVNTAAEFGAGATKSTFTSIGALFINPGSSITVTGDTGYVSSQSSITTSGGLFGSGGGITALNASQLTAGTVPNARLDSTSATLQGNSFNSANQLVKTDANTAVTLASTTLTATGNDVYSLTTSSGIKLAAGPVYLNTGGFIRFADGTTQASAAGASGAGLASTQTFTGSNTFRNPVVISTNLPNVTIPAANAIYSENVVKAYVNFSGTGTVTDQGSFNVSSITDGGVGLYTVNFARAMANTDFTAVTTVEITNSFTCNINARSTTSVTVRCVDAASNPGDINRVTVVVLGRQ